VIAFIDDDCEVTREWIPALLDAYRDPRVACVAGRNLLSPEANPVQRTTAQYVSGRGDTDRVVHPSDLGNVYTRAIVGSGSNFSVRRAAAISAGGFSETLRSGEEVFLFVRLLRTGHSLAFAHRATVTHHHRERATQQVSRIAFYGRHTAILFLYLAMLDRRLWLFAFNCARAAAVNVRDALVALLRGRFLIALYAIAQSVGITAGAATAWLTVPALRAETSQTPISSPR
jgi:GT2 family glycosyltransferase